MRIDRRLVLIGVMLIVLSMTMATQYATTRVTYSFALVHPSDADIRFIASDNSSDDSLKVLRVTTNGSATRFLTIELGDWFPASTKNYSAAFGIVNEENFPVNITHINMSGTNAGYIDLWLHGDRSADWPADAGTKIMAVDDGVDMFSGGNSVMWTLAAGDGNPSTMANATTQIATGWDDTSGVRYSLNDANNSVNETSDFVWVGLTLDIPANAADSATNTGTIFVHFQATTRG